MLYEYRKLDASENITAEENDKKQAYYQKLRNAGFLYDDDKRYKEYLKLVNKIPEHHEYNKKNYHTKEEKESFEIILQDIISKLEPEIFKM